MEKVKAQKLQIEKTDWNKFILIFVTGMIIGSIILGIFIFFGVFNGLMTDGQCSDIANLYYNQGIINVANFTTVTGNFTYIFNGSIRTQGVQDYCVGMIQNLNIQKEVN